MTPAQPPYQQIANDLRAAIIAGTYRAGETIPKITDLQEAYGVGRQTVRSAILLLETEGLVQARRHQGTVVRPLPSQIERIGRSRTMHRDTRGYYSDTESEHWQGIGPSRVSWAPAPADIAALLGVDTATPVLVRDRLVGASPRDPRQIATSHIHPDIAEGTILAEVSTGPGGIYDRLEEMGHGPLRWREKVSATAPSPTEAERLRLLPGVPLLRILRISTSSATGGVVDVTAFLMSSALYEVEYPVTRAASARWPVRSATSPNVPFRPIEPPETDSGTPSSRDTPTGSASHASGEEEAP